MARGRNYENNDMMLQGCGSLATEEGGKEGGEGDVNIPKGSDTLGKLKPCDKQ